MRCGDFLVRFGGVICVLGVVLLIVLLSVSFKKVDPNHVALGYNKVTRNIGDEVRGEGLALMGPSIELIVFKTTQQEAKHQNMSALSADSIDVNLDVRILYTVKRDKIRDIIDKFYDEDGHDEFIKDFSAGLVRLVASRFTAKQFYLERQRFQADLTVAVRDRFNASGAQATVDSVQVVSVGLPQRVLAAMEAATVAEQDIQNAVAERAARLQAASIRLDLAQSEANLILISAARDQILIEQAAQQALGVERQKQASRADAFSNISTGLGRGGDFFVRSYLKYLMLQANQGSNVVQLP